MLTFVRTALRKVDSTPMSYFSDVSLAVLFWDLKLSMEGKRFYQMFPPKLRQSSGCELPPFTTGGGEERVGVSLLVTPRDEVPLVAVTSLCFGRTRLDSNKEFFSS